MVVGVKLRQSFSAKAQGRTTSRAQPFIGFRELTSARGNTLLQLFVPVEHYGGRPLEIARHRREPAAHKASLSWNTTDTPGVGRSA